MKLWVVTRRIVAHTGEQMSYPVALRESEEVAKSFRDLANKELGMACATRLMVRDQNGLFHEGPTVTAFLADLGIGGLGHAYQELELAGSNLVTPDRRIVIPRS